MDKKYRLILCDPPWNFDTRSPKGGAKSPQAQYDTMTIEEIKALPVSDFAADDCMLVMWCTNPHLEKGLEVMKAWGFNYVTQGTWHKKTKNDKSQFGTGYRLRSSSEPILIGTKGKMPLKARNIRSLFETEEDFDTIDYAFDGFTIEAKVRGHSRKPDHIYTICEGLADGPYLEMFARQNWSADWDIKYSNEATKFEVEHGYLNP